MHIVAIAWLFVAILMAAAEATSAQGTVLGALFTLLLYGLLPVAIIVYILGTPARRRARRAAEAAAEPAAPHGAAAEPQPAPSAGTPPPAPPAG
ncbi:hypothetical protein [Ideonella sp.]|uniref:hypothetical protein n=1 Tax=Ideonella sp. TaxID=1929293 RepID=UPI0035B3CAB9